VGIIHRIQGGDQELRGEECKSSAERGGKNFVEKRMETCSGSAGERKEGRPGQKKLLETPRNSGRGEEGEVPESLIWGGAERGKGGGGQIRQEIEEPGRS